MSWPQLGPDRESQIRNKRHGLTGARSGYPGSDRAVIGASTAQPGPDKGRMFHHRSTPCLAISAREDNILNSYFVLAQARPWHDKPWLGMKFRILSGPSIVNGSLQRFLPNPFRNFSIWPWSEMKPRARLGPSQGGKGLAKVLAIIRSPNFAQIGRTVFFSNWGMPYQALTGAMAIFLALYFKL